MTMAYGPERYLRMAKGMVRSIRLYDRKCPVAIVTDRSPASLSRWFDIVVPVDHSFGSGLAQKLHLDCYAPFDETLFVDADFLFFRDPHTVWDKFRAVSGFGLYGYHMNPGDEHYAVEDLSAFTNMLGMNRMIMTNTGILYFDRSAIAGRVFELARELASKADSLGVQRHPAGFFNDEPIFAAAVELLGLPLVHVDERPLFKLAHLGTEGLMEVDVRRKTSRHSVKGEEFEPALIHFNVGSQGSRVYDRELRRLEFGRFLGRTPLPDLVTAAVWNTLRPDIIAAARRRWRGVRRG
jgi:hypothetical protein